jgi:amino acid transporter
MGGIQ